MRHWRNAMLLAATLPGCGPAATTPASKSEPPSEAPARTIEALARDIAAQLARGDAQAVTAHFDDTMRAALPAVRLTQVWTTLENQLGAFDRIGGTRRRRVQGFDVVLVRMAFERGEVDLKLVFDAEERITGLFVVPPSEEHDYQPPAYARLDAIEEREITIGAEPWRLPGTLTLPREGRPCPALVLIHGSGPHDRDQTLGPNKPFRDLALGLASRGVAVLRFEKRTKHHGAAMQAKIGERITIDHESVEDALAAVERLRSTGEVDRNRIFVLGHSAGGMAIPRIARRGPSIRGFVIMAGSTQPLEDIVYRQMEYLAKLDGKLSEKERPILAQVKVQVARVKTLTAESRVPSSELPLGIPVAYWVDLAAHPPEKEIAGEKRPVLVLHGERDYQVTQADLDGWKLGLRGAPGATIKSYPKLNHLFMEGEGKSTPAEYQTPSHIAPYVIDDISAWVRSHR